MILKELEDTHWSLILNLWIFSLHAGKALQYRIKRITMVMIDQNDQTTKPYT